jgi:hypothetical protein
METQASMRQADCGWPARKAVDPPAHQPGESRQWLRTKTRVLLKIVQLTSKVHRLMSN